MAYLYFLFICLSWGVNFLLMKKALLSFGPITIGTWRVVGGVAVVGAFWLLKSRRWPLPRSYWGPMLFVSIVGYVWPFVITPYLIARYGSGFIGMTACFVPLMTIAASVPMLGVYPTARQLFGVVVGFACLGLILVDGVARNITAWDFLLAISAPLTYAICNTYIKRRFTGVTPLDLTLSALCFTGLFTLPLTAALILGGAPSEAVRIDANFGQSMLGVFGLSVIGTGLALLAFNRLIQEKGPLFAGMVTYVVPALALLWGWADGERVTLLQWLALTGVLLMVAVVQYPTSVLPPLPPEAAKDEPPLESTPLA